MQIWFLISIIATVMVTTSIFFATAYNDKITYDVILETDKTVIGQNIEYPSGSPLITSKIVTVPTGAETGIHMHPYPLFGYVLEGEITLDYGEDNIKTFERGDSLMEAINHEHKAKNMGTEDAVILVVMMGQK